MALPALKPSESRRDKRGQIQYRLHFSVRGRRHAGDGYIDDMSTNGCCIKSLIAVQQGETLELSIEGSNGNIITIDETLVRWVRPDGFGVSFTHMRRPAKVWLDDVCRRLSLGR